MSLNRYADEAELIRNLQLPNCKSCSVDLATGTGKSYLIYAIAAIALNEGLVDKVLVLCPSLTIETGLWRKFQAFISSSDLLDSLPSLGFVPGLVNSTQTVMKGDICIENIHAVYANSTGSVRDSFASRGDRVLVLNDESHHIFNSLKGSETSIKKWKDFLLSPEFGFKYVVNFTGTPFIGNEYFCDVVYQYQLSDAINDGVVKRPQYLIEAGDEQKVTSYSEIYQNHINIQRDLEARGFDIKPISIVVTSDVERCFEVWEQIVLYLIKTEKISRESAEERCIWVTSRAPKGSSEKRRLENLSQLEKVDQSDNPVQWIVSVSMLTEGWDVKNVFQIVPHDSRAFNSRLLIAQVLGRGLRVPAPLKGSDPVVIVYNHVKFGREIEQLFKDVLDVSDRIPLPMEATSSTYHFGISNIVYKRVEERLHVRKAAEKFTEKIELRPQSRELSNRVVYRDYFKRARHDVTYSNPVAWCDLNDAVAEVRTMLKGNDLETGSELASEFPAPRIESLIVKNLMVVTDPPYDYITLENLQRVKNAFVKLYDKGGVSLVFRDHPDSLKEIHTSEIGSQSVNASQVESGLPNGRTLFLKPTLISDSSVNEFHLLNELIRGFEEENGYDLVISDFKSPQRAFATSHKPERIFFRKLIDAKISEFYDSFVKSPDSGFFSLPYTVKIGSHVRYRSFNPDLILKKGSQRIVVEIKHDDEDSLVTRKKFEYALAHFKEINSRLGGKDYLFLLLSPVDYTDFFVGLQQDDLKTFQTSLAAKFSLQNS